MSNSENKQEQTKVIKKTTTGSVLIGGVSGAIEAYIMYPTEFVKTSVQLQKKGADQLNGASPGPAQVIRSTLASEGVTGFYRGVTALAIGSAAKAGVRFGAFETVKRFLVDETGQLTPTKTFFAGLFAGACEAIAVAPTEVVKTKLIHDAIGRSKENQKYKGLVHGFSTIVKEEGMTGLYRGVLPTIMKQGSNQAARFTVFGWLKNMWQGGDPKAPFEVWKSLISGGIAGAVSVMLNNPLDVIKTQMQGMEASKYRGVIHCFMTLLKTQGPMFFYKGVTPRLARVCGDTAIVFSLNEKLWQIYSSL